MTYFDSLSPIKMSEKTQASSSILHVVNTSTTGAVTEIHQAMLRDHLGSVDVVNDTVAPIRMAFEPFGGRRDATTWAKNITAPDLVSLLSQKNRLNLQGYTGHESLDRTGLTHMNGRVYDPQLGRFLSPDPLVQSPTNSQSWNRYSYVFNNPLKYTDPTGYAGLGCAGGTVTQEGYGTKFLPNTCGGGAPEAEQRRGTGSAENGGYDPIHPGTSSDEIGGTSQQAPSSGSGGCEYVTSISCALQSALESGLEVSGVVDLGAAILDAYVAVDTKNYAELKPIVQGAAVGFAMKRVKVAEAVYKTTKEAKVAAEKLGFKKIKETIHDGQAVFKKGNQYITRDLDGHNGGAWKMANSVSDLGAKETRRGTFDATLTIKIGD